MLRRALGAQGRPPRFWHRAVFFHLIRFLSCSWTSSGTGCRQSARIGRYCTARRSSVGMRRRDTAARWDCNQRGFRADLRPEKCLSQNSSRLLPAAFLGRLGALLGHSSAVRGAYGPSRAPSGCFVGSGRCFGAFLGPWTGFRCPTTTTNLRRGFICTGTAVNPRRNCRNMGRKGWGRGYGYGVPQPGFFHCSPAHMNSSRPPLDTTALR